MKQIEAINEELIIVQDNVNIKFINVMSGKCLYLLNDSLSMLDINIIFNSESTIMNNYISRLMKGSIAKFLIIKY